MYLPEVFTMPWFMHLGPIGKNIKSAYIGRSLDTTYAAFPHQSSVIQHDLKCPNLFPSIEHIS
jgi:hypothetical protein